MDLGNRIAIIGNAGGGKTTLARTLARTLGLPVTHVDSIEYQSEWNETPVAESDARLAEIAQGQYWIIEGFGSNSAIENRLELADTAIHVDFPFWRHLWWVTKRQSKAYEGQRIELPENCPEFSLIFTRELVKFMWKVHREKTPLFRKLMSMKQGQSGNALVIRNPGELNSLLHVIEETKRAGTEERCGAGGDG